MKFPARGMADMLNYLSKFVLQMLPTISATVIGAYIVSTWINPKTPAEPPKIAARSQEQKPAKAAPAPAEPAQEVAAESTDAKAAEAPAETAKPAKATSVTDKVRIIPIVKQLASATEAAPAPAASVPSPEPAAAAQDERKDANTLARAAIQRLRGSETARAADEPARPVVAPPRVQPVRAAAEPSPSPVARIAPPLPPAVSIASPRVMPAEGEAVSDRLSPPAEIPPARSPLNLLTRQRVADNPSLADDFLSATKSFFRAITPQ